MRARQILIGLGSIAILALLAYLIIPRLHDSDREAKSVSWPTQSWLSFQGQVQNPKCRLARFCRARFDEHPEIW